MEARNVPTSLLVITEFLSFLQQNPTKELSVLTVFTMFWPLPHMNMRKLQDGQWPTYGKSQSWYSALIVLDMSTILDTGHLSHPLEIVSYLPPRCHTPWALVLPQWLPLHSFPCEGASLLPSTKVLMEWIPGLLSSTCIHSFDLISLKALDSIHKLMTPDLHPHAYNSTLLNSRLTCVTSHSVFPILGMSQSHFKRNVSQTEHLISPHNTVLPVIFPISTTGKIHPQSCLGQTCLNHSQFLYFIHTPYPGSQQNPSDLPSRSMQKMTTYTGQDNHLI